MGTTPIVPKLNESSLSPPPSGDITTPLLFSKRLPSDETPYIYTKCLPPEGVPYTNIRGEPSMVTVHDLRGEERSISLVHDSIHIVQNIPITKTNFDDDEDIRKNYYPLVEQQIMANVPSAAKVHIFRHGIRHTRKFPVPYSPPSLIARQGLTSTAVIDRIRWHLEEEEAERLLQGRYRVIYFWQTLNGTVYTCPLAMASSATVKDEDIVTMVSHFKDFSEEFGAPIYRDHQKWYYLSGVRADEAIMLQIFDSYRSNPGSGVMGGHAAYVDFKDPRTPANAPDRWSIETFALVFGP
ncbi:Methyltransferase [Aspergillus sclerotialis]|uniref:Methyltransferase n=1 Tax=Aspergillus sclerotialis TaxID=2070753 RepID=A0A3A3A5Y6_9EURO|nr:Methyltransferase [Aspergillus sclerotialis]